MRTAKLTIGTTPVQVPVGDGDVPVLANQGTTNMFFSSTAGVSVNNGLPLAPGMAFEFPHNLQQSEWDEVWVVSDAPGGDLRYGTVG